MLIYQYFHLFKKQNLQLDAFDPSMKAVYFQNGQITLYLVIVISKKDLAMFKLIFSLYFHVQKNQFRNNFPFDIETYPILLYLKIQRNLYFKLLVFSSKPR